MKINEIEIDFLSNNLNLNSLDEKNYTSIDSFTINQENNTITSIIVLNRDEKIPSEDEMISYFNIEPNYSHMLNRLLLSKSLDIPLYLISVEDNFKKCQILKLSFDKSNTLIFNFFNDKELITHKELANFFQDLRNEKRNNPKPLTHTQSSDLIKKFIDSGISLGGNLDGFKIDKKERKIKLVEFSKIGATKSNYDYDGSKTISYNLNKFMKQDFGRWHALETLRKEINKKHDVSLDIIIWSFINSHMKIFKNVTFDGDRNQYLKANYSEEIKSYNHVVNKIKI